LEDSNSGQNCPKPIRQNGQIAFHVNIQFALRPFFGQSKLTHQINVTALCVRFSDAQNLTERIVLEGVSVSFTPSAYLSTETVPEIPTTHIPNLSIS